METALILFIVCTFANVVISTIKSVMTIKGGKVNAAIWNALGYGLYAYIVVMTANAPISTLGKVLITVGCNLIGVYGVKLVEEKLRKDKMWRIEMTVRDYNAIHLHDALTAAHISNHYVNAGTHTVFTCYCENKEATETALECGKLYNAKCFANETTLTP